MGWPSHASFVLANCNFYRFLFAESHSGHRPRHVSVRYRGLTKAMRVHQRDVVQAKGVALTLLVFIALSLPFSDAVFGAQAPSADACLSCHGMPGLEKERAGKKISLSVDPQRFSKSVHAALGCTACHSDASQAPHPPNLKPVECSGCHAAIAKIYDGSVHGRATHDGDADAATCSDCHGKHDIMRGNDPASKVYPLQLPYTCGVCHGDPALAKKHNIPVANAYQLYMDSIHGRALTKSGLLVSANCASCHGSHGIKAKKEEGSRVAKTQIPSTCGGCHAGVESLYRDSVHGKAVTSGNPFAPVCTDCHTAHEIRRVEGPAWQLEIVRECGTCHRESLRTYRDTFHGQVTALGFARVARCSDCHGSHSIRAMADPKSAVASANLVSTCQKCHPKASASFVLFSPHADPADKDRNPSLYYAARFMHALLAGVFIFFGLHGVLWLLRSSIEVWRRRSSSEHGKGD